MIEFHFGNSNTLACFGLYRLLQDGRENCLQRRVETVGLRFWTSRHDHLSACIHKPHERISERRRDRSGIVQNYERVIRNTRWIDRSGALQRERERETVVRRERALKIQTVAAYTRSALDDQRLGRCLAAQSEIEAIVRREVSGANINRAAVRAVVQIECRKLADARVAIVAFDVALLDSFLFVLEVDFDVVLRHVAEVADMDHEIVFVLLSKDDTARLDIRDRDVWRRGASADVG